MSTATITLTFTLAEFATLVRIVDEGMWELVSKPRAARDVELQDRVCQILGLPGYVPEDATPSGAMRYEFKET